MDRMEPWMRPKVKADTFFLPDDDESVYFRNYAGSFKMEGTAVQSWIEKLLPLFDGQHTLASLTEGLPQPYRERIFQIAGILYENGFLRDVSTDKKHKLPKKIMQQYSSQIEFIDNLIGSGAFRFETYRNARVLAIGTGFFLSSLAAALAESGLIKVYDLAPQLAQSQRFLKLVETMDAVLYVSPAGGTEELCRIEAVCGRANILFIPAIYVDSLGIVGPTTWPDTFDGTSAWEGAWRRIHSTALQYEAPICADTVLAILANVLVFQLFKSVTGIESHLTGRRFYILNSETLEGRWHDFVPATPAVKLAALQRTESLHGITGGPARMAVESARALIEYAKATDESANRSMADLLADFVRITDKTSGIFHLWDEGNLQQLPLAQCRVQPVDPLSNGPAELLPQIVCSGLTHEEARRESGIVGIEYYVSRLAEGFLHREKSMKVSAGATLAEAVGRGLQQSLVAVLKERLSQKPEKIRRVILGEVRDEKCKLSLASLCAMGLNPVVALGEEVLGCSVVWLDICGDWVGSAGFSVSMALQRALEYALLRRIGKLEDNGVWDERWVATASAFRTEEDVFFQEAPLDIEAWQEFDLTQIAFVIDAIRRNGRNISLVDLALEPFLQETLAGVYGVSVVQREGLR